MYFTDINGHRLLYELTRPDGSIYYYSYDSSDNLVSVGKPRPDNNGGYLYQTYGGYLSFMWAAGPRCSSDAQCSDGGYVAFQFAPNSPGLQLIQWVGNMNPAPSDGTGTLVQPGVATGKTQYKLEYVSAAASSTAYVDTDGHQVVQYFTPAGSSVGAGTPTVRKEYTGTQWLSTASTWNAANNLASTTDSRGNETDYAYDANGNTIAVAKPAASPGQIRPLELYSYDAFNNVGGYCDPMVNGSLRVWTASYQTSQSDSLCPSGSGIRFSYAYTASDAYGELSDTYSATGYHRHLAYAASAEGGSSIDYGLPTSMTGDSIAQIDGTTRTPSASLVYDANGNLSALNTGIGTSSFTYDALARMTSETDADSHTSYVSYYPDGSVAMKQSPSQRAAGIGVAFTYDVDGNESSETHHYGCLTVASCSGGVTRKWYDGADRLVEVQLPYDGWDIQGFPWSNRYIYDLTSGGTTSYNGSTIRGYGNLVKTQELLAGTVFQPNTTSQYPLSSASWTDVRATSYDALDRPLAAYEAAFGSAPKASNTYDANGFLGLLSSESLATGESKQLNYDLADEVVGVTYPSGASTTPSLTYQYDLDGRITQQGTSTLGLQALAYNADGQLTSIQEPAALGSGVITNHYYPDGNRKDVGYASSTGSYPQVESFAYRIDGLRSLLRLSNNTSFSWLYTAAGRQTSQSDPLTGVAIQPDATYGKNVHYYPQSITYAAKTTAYDSFGRVDSVTLPEGVFSYTGISYDLEDAIALDTVQESVGGQQIVPVNVCLLSNVRNEKVPWNASYNDCSSNAGPRHDMFNGTDLADQPWTIDARVSRLLSFAIPSSIPNVLSSGSTLTYDVAGRMTAQSEAGHEPNPNFPSTSPSTYFTTGTRSLAYDAENHLRSDVYSTVSSLNNGVITGGFWIGEGYFSDPNQQPDSLTTIDYTADGHPARFARTTANGSGGTQPFPLFWLWDNDERFVKCQQVAGNPCLPTFSIEGLGSFTPSNSVTTIVNDRNLYGAVATSHDSVSFAAFGDASPTRSWGGPPRQANPCSSGACAQSVGYAGLPDDKITSDGWTHQNDTWQGVRTYDSISGQWSTPDQYGGDVDDPMPQQPYTWNNNNPFDYSDPSGYACSAGAQATADAEHAIGCVGSNPSDPDFATTYGTFDNAANFVEGLQNIAIEGVLSAVPIGRGLGAIRRAASSRRLLAKNLGEKVNGLEAHHIVAFWHPVAEEARGVWQKLESILTTREMEYG